MRGNIDVDSIPEFQRNALFDMALDITRECFSIPGMEERYQQGFRAILNGSGSAKQQKKGADTDGILLDLPRMRKQQRSGRSL